jgi:hypothetical protein
MWLMIGQAISLTPASLKRICNPKMNMSLPDISNSLWSLLPKEPIYFPSQVEFLVMYNCRYICMSLDIWCIYSCFKTNLHPHWCIYIFSIFQGAYHYHGKSYSYLSSPLLTHVSCTTVLPLLSISNNIFCRQNAYSCSGLMWYQKSA